MVEGSRVAQPILGLKKKPPTQHELAVARNRAYNKALNKRIRQRFFDRRCVVCCAELVEETHTFCGACFRRLRRTDRMVMGGIKRPKGKLSSDGKDLCGWWLRAVRTALRHLPEPQPMAGEVEQRSATGTP